MMAKYRKKEIISVRYNLRLDGDKTDDKTPVPINLYATINGKRLKYATGFKIAPKDWIHGDHSQPGRPKKYIADPLLRKRLKDLERWIQELYQESDKQITAKEIRQELDYRTGRKERPQPEGQEKLSFFDYFDQFIKKQQEKKGANRDGWKKYITAKNHISDYAAELGQNIDFDYWNISTLEEFESWLYDEPRELSQNTVSKIADNLKAVMRAAYESTPQHHTNSIFKSKSFTVSRVKTKRKGRLTLDEIDQLAAADFSNDPALDQARDLMLIGCFTGLRFSDWHKVDREYITLDEDGDEVLNIITKKGTQQVFIPVLPILKQVLEKYDYKLPKMVSQTFNRRIKKAVELAGIESTYTIIENVGGQTTPRQNVPKYEMVSSHWGRRSFASNFYEELDIPPKHLMQITGHTTEKQFFNYIEYDKVKMARRTKFRIKQAMQERRGGENRYLKIAK